MQRGIKRRAAQDTGRGGIEMRNLTCIVCPMGCSLAVEEGEMGSDGFPLLTVTGNRCPRGAVYAQEEIRSPKRVVTATCAVVWGAEKNEGGGLPSTPGRTGFSGPRRVPVKTSGPCPREKIGALLREIYKTKVRLPVKAGDKILPNWEGLGIDVVAVRDLG
jgi:CxxC motif-containing protein